MLSLPKPHREEHLLGWIVRTAFFYDLPLRRAHDLFGVSRPLTSTLCPGWGRKIAQALDMSPRELYFNHTEFGVNALFLKQCHRDMLFNSFADGLGDEERALTMHLIRHILDGKVGGSIKYCPQCIAGSFEQHGGPVFLQEWQMPLINRCAKHGCFLLNRRVTALTRSKLLSEQVPTQPPPSAAVLSEESESAIRASCLKLMRNPPRKSPTPFSLAYNLSHASVKNKDMIAIYPQSEDKCTVRFHDRRFPQAKGVNLGVLHMTFGNGYIWTDQDHFTAGFNFRRLGFFLVLHYLLGVEEEISEWLEAMAEGPEV